MYVGEISALITAVLWSGTAIVFTEATKIVGSYAVNITRLLLATLYLIFTILLFNLNYQISWEQIYLLGLSGVIGLVFGDGFLFKSFQYIYKSVSFSLYYCVSIVGRNYLTVTDKYVSEAYPTSHPRVS